MRHPRRLALLMPLVFAATACAPFGRDAPPSAAARFATTLEASDPAVDSAIAVMDNFERRSMREERAVAFALGRSAGPALQPGAPVASAAEAAGDVMAPAFTALGDYAHVLGQVAAGVAPEPRQTMGAEVLSQAVAQALPGTRVAIPAPVQQAGIAGTAALVRLAQQAPAERGLSAQALAQQAAPHLDAVATLLKAVLGTEPGTATRGAIRARREGMESARLRMLEAARRDPGLGAAGRYALYHEIAGLRDQDPLPGTLATIVQLLGAMEAAHAAIAAGDPAAEAKVGAFEGALAQLGAVTGQDLTPAAE